MKRNARVFAFLSKEMLEAEIVAIKKGCGNKVQKGDGDCSYISSHGNLRLCKKCLTHLRLAKIALEAKK